MGTVLGLGFVAPVSLAQEQPLCLEFQADRAKIDLSTRRLELQGHVSVQAGKYGLHAESLQLGKQEESLQVVGPATLTLCPCDRAPIELDFDRATLEFAGDITMTSPTLRVGDTPVFWLPWVWFRSWDQPGLLPPKLAWRGDGGLLLGPGFHLPWKDGVGQPAHLDLYISGYTRGGFELESSITTTRSRTNMRFDRMHGDLVRLESEGSQPSAGPGGLTWRVDTVGGSRGVTGLIDIREAYRPFDEAAAHVEVQPSSYSWLYAGVAGTGIRGRDRLHWGPSLLAHAGGALGIHSGWEASGKVRVLDDANQDAAHLTMVRARWFAAPILGPSKISVDGQSIARSLSLYGHSSMDVVAWSTSEASFPFARSYASTVHLIEPFVRVVGLSSARTAEPSMALLPPAIAGGSRWTATVGIRSDLGPPGASRGFRWEALAGKLGDFEGNTIDSAVVARAGLVQDWVTIQAQAAVLTRSEYQRAFLLARTSVGGMHSAKANIDIASRSNTDPVDAAAFEPSTQIANPCGVLSQSGTSLSVGGHLPLGSTIRAEVMSDWDLGEKAWLSTGSGLVLEHPCGCLQGRAWVSRRVGREGTDAWLALELQ